MHFIRASSDEITINVNVGVPKNACKEPDTESNTIELHIETVSEGITKVKDVGNSNDVNKGCNSV